MPQMIIDIQIKLLRRKRRCYKNKSWYYTCINNFKL